MYFFFIVFIKVKNNVIFFLVLSLPAPQDECSYLLQGLTSSLCYGILSMYI